MNVEKKKKKKDEVQCDRGILTLKLGSDIWQQHVENKV